ncbi:MAG: tetratricopeptide repeat protein, partial [Dehalococcoidales bacterium]|nr:tetratricopeptide repeat protein [Dehalococcoidales bacterium]
QYDLAIADYNKAIELDPKNANAYLNRAFAYYNNKQYDLAIADYNKVIELDPKNGYVYNNRGLAYYYKGQYESAIADYNKAIELDPKDADAWNNKGVALQKLGRPGEAMVCYDNALQIDPSHESAKSNKASLMASADGSQREDGLPAFSDPDRIVIFPGQEIRGVISDNSSEREGTITNHVTPLILRAYGGKPQVPGPPYKWSFPLMESGPMAIHMESNGLVTLRKSSLPLLPEGTYPFAVEVTDGTRTTRGTVTLQVERWVPTGTGLGHLPAPVIAGQSLSPGKGEYLLPDAKAGRAYGATLLIFGGEPPYWFQHAPAYFASSGDFFSSGLRIDPTTGVVYGVVDPQVAGKTLRFGVSVRDGSGLEGGLVPGPPERFPVYSIKVIP